MSFFFFFKFTLGRGICLLQVFDNEGHVIVTSYSISESCLTFSCFPRYSLKSWLGLMQTHPSHYCSAFLFGDHLSKLRALVLEGMCLHLKHFCIYFKWCSGQEGCGFNQYVADGLTKWHAASSLTFLKQGICKDVALVCSKCYRKGNSVCSSLG